MKKVLCFYLAMFSLSLASYDKRYEIEIIPDRKFKVHVLDRKLKIKGPLKGMGYIFKTTELVYDVINSSLLNKDLFLISDKENEYELKKIKYIDVTNQGIVEKESNISFKKKINDKDLILYDDEYAYLVYINNNKLEFSPISLDADYKSNMQLIDRIVKQEVNKKIEENLYKYIKIGFLDNSLINDFNHTKFDITTEFNTTKRLYNIGFFNATKLFDYNTGNFGFLLSYNRLNSDNKFLFGVYNKNKINNFNIVEKIGYTHTKSDKISEKIKLLDYDYEYKRDNLYLSLELNSNIRFNEIFTLSPYLEYSLETGEINNFNLMYNKKYKKKYNIFFVNNRLISILNMNFNINDKFEINVNPNITYSNHMYKNNKINMVNLFDIGLNTDLNYKNPNYKINNKLGYIYDFMNNEHKIKYNLEILY